MLKQKKKKNQQSYTAGVWFLLDLLKGILSLRE